MPLSDILAPDAVMASLRVNSKKQVLQELSERAAVVSGLPAREIFDSLLQRERLGSTGVGDGIAIPHGKLRGITKILGVFGRSTAGVDFDSLDGNPTQLFFLLIAPEDSASLHLKALARVSRLFKDAGFRQHLLEAPDAAEIYRLLKEEDSKY
jgi:PTS system nitrogen regulatory IIA component